jgi:hypothetical protein
MQKEVTALKKVNSKSKITVTAETVTNINDVP